MKIIDMRTNKTIDAEKEKVVPYSWEEATRPAQKEDFDWSPGWNKPDPGPWMTRWAKFRVWLMNVHINYVMWDMFRWMTEESNLKLFIEEKGNKERHAIAKARHDLLEKRFHDLLEVRNAYAAKYRVKAHPNSPERKYGKKEIR